MQLRDVKFLNNQKVKNVIFSLSLCLLTMVIAQLLMTWRPNENECLTVIHRAREKLSVKSASPESLHHTLPYFSSVGTKRYTKFVLPKHYIMLNLIYTTLNTIYIKRIYTLHVLRLEDKVKKNGIGLETQREVGSGVPNLLFH